MSQLTSRQPFPWSRSAVRTTESPISWLMAKTVGDPEILSLAAGFVDTDTLPQDLVKTAFEKVFADASNAREILQYGITPGSRRLRQELAKRLERQGLTNVDPDCIVISNGGQQSLYTVTNVMVDPGDIVLVEDPTYFVYMDVLRSAGARVIGVKTDSEGMMPDALEERFAELRAEGVRDRLKILYVMSYFTNPKGCNPSTERRKALFDIYQRELADGQYLMIEDASYRDLCLEGPDEPFIKAHDPSNEHIFLSGTFSKAFAPGFRLGWSYMPRELHDAVARQKGNQDFGSSNMNQAIVAELLASGAFEIAAGRFRDRYRAKRDVMLAALKEFWPSSAHVLKPMGGLYVWTELEGINTDPGSEFFNRVLEKKVLYVPGRYCLCDETQGPRLTNGMRLCYGVIRPEPMREAVRRMGEVVAAMS
ncbi:aminotransferase class I/II-fold pyridoxal phosphate-dependent enzyme [bacterium]|nr:aminotransferase class I/II-fold pyridoxal phosphate-dependent enzyme [bacterium]